MAVGEDKVRILITVPKAMKKELETMANKDNRTTSNLIATILKEYIDTNRYSK